jgi:uncharacterized protein YebE (UPF0316 family)
MWLYLGVFSLELINSCIAAMRTILLSHNRKWLAPAADVVNENINYLVGFIIYVETKNIWLGFAASIASGIGTKLAMHIKIPRRKQKRIDAFTLVNI